MKKSLALVLLFILVTSLFVGCQNSMAKVPGIRVTSGDSEIQQVSGLNKWDGAVYDRMENFLYYFDIGNKPQYLEIGSEITIEFEGQQPDAVQITDAVLTESGKLKYADAVTKQVEFTRQEETFSFPLADHVAVYLSSDLADYEPKSVLRGFKLLCTWGENECEYAFIIRTDP